MALKVLYEAGLSAEHEDITDRVRIGALDVTQNAEEGSVALSSIIIDDPDGDYEIKGYRHIAIYETEGTDGVDELTYNGHIVDRRIIRGPYRTGAGRQWVVSMADTNVLLEYRIMTGEDCDRPAETDIERMDWLLGTSEMSRIPNHDYYNTTGPVAMDAVDYRGQRAVDVINDCAQSSGKNYFAFCIDTTPAPLPAAPGATTLWYDYADSDEYVSTLKLSNDLADVLAEPGVCFEISLDTELARDPSRVYSGAYLRYDGGDEYEEDLDISNEFTRRDAVVPAENIKTSAKATARALRYLSDMSTEEDRITTAVLLPAAKVNLIREGMQIPFKATHFPVNYRNFVWQRVLQRKVKQLTEEFYLVTLTLGWGPSTPHLTLTGCNTVTTDAGRNAIVAPVDGDVEPGQTWRYEATNTVHDPEAITDNWRITADNAVEVHILTPAGGSQGASPPFSVVPVQTGTFVIPGTVVGPNFGFIAKANYAGTPLVDECWEVKLWRES